MEEKQMILCDTDVIIEFYQDNPKIVRELMHIGQDQIAVSIITYAELLFGAFNKREQNQIKKDLASLRILMIDFPVCLTFRSLMEKYSVSHRISIPDALVAATALESETTLFTLNAKDYRFIERLNLYTFAETGEDNG